MDSFNIFLYIYAAVVFIQLLHHLFFTAGWPGAEPKPSGQELPGVSVIVCARNEDTNLKQHLPLLLRQDYPAFEVIVVDDNSDDGTVNTSIIWQKRAIAETGQSRQCEQANGRKEISAYSGYQGSTVSGGAANRC